MNYKKYILILAQLHSTKRAKFSVDESEVTIDASSPLGGWEISTPIYPKGDPQLFKQFFGCCQHYPINSQGGLITTDADSVKIKQKTPKLSSFQSCKYFLQHFTEQAAHWKELLMSVRS